MPRPLRIAVLLLALLAIICLAMAAPDLGTLVIEKITEGGMWTALAVFIAGAALLGAQRGKPDARS